MALSPAFAKGDNKIVVEGTLSDMPTDIFKLGIGDQTIALKIDVLVGAGGSAGGLMTALPWRSTQQQVKKGYVRGVTK